EPGATEETHKLRSKFGGPYIARRVLGKDRYLIEDISDMQVTTRKYSSVRSSDKLKLGVESIPKWMQLKKKIIAIKRFYPVLNIFSPGIPVCLKTVPVLEVLASERDFEREVFFFLHKTAQTFFSG
ncbi:hypothetical protein EVAR_73612_1, partial [Eumeta japonica]